MTEAVYFVVERCPGGEMPAIYHDLLPQRLTRKIPLDRGQPCEPSPIIYVVRLDTMRGAHGWLAEFLKKPIAEIYAEYCRRRDGKDLPPSNLAGPAKKAEGARRKIGEFWEPPKRAWEDRPTDPLPAPGSLTLRPDAGAFIGGEGE